MIPSFSHFSLPFLPSTPSSPTQALLPELQRYKDTRQVYCTRRADPRTPSMTTWHTTLIVHLLKSHFCIPILDFGKSTEKDRVSDQTNKKMKEPHPNYLDEWVDSLLIRHVHDRLDEGEEFLLLVPHVHPLVLHYHFQRSPPPRIQNQKLFEQVFAVCG